MKLPMIAGIAGMLAAPVRVRPYWGSKDTSYSEDQQKIIDARRKKAKAAKQARKAQRKRNR